mgnify:CR=1 FL=1
MGEIINKFYEYVETGKKELIDKYTLEEIKQARYKHKRDNSKLPDLALVMDGRIKELENIYTDRKREREKWIDRIISFITGIVTGLLLAYLKERFKL